MIKLILYTVLPPLAMYLSFVFGTATFDISQWSEYARVACAVVMLLLASAGLTYPNK